MPSSFFLLLRFFLRIDGVLIRMNDTRLYHEVAARAQWMCSLMTGSVCAVASRENWKLHRAACYVAWFTCSVGCGYWHGTSSFPKVLVAENLLHKILPTVGSGGDDAFKKSRMYVICVQENCPLAGSPLQGTPAPSRPLLPQVRDLGHSLSWAALALTPLLGDASRAVRTAQLAVCWILCYFFTMGTNLSFLITKIKTLMSLSCVFLY